MNMKTAKTASVLKALGILAAILVHLPAARATGIDLPMIEVGGGLQNEASETVNILLRVSVDNLTVHSRPDNRPNLVIARIKGNAVLSQGAFNGSADSMASRLPYADIEFVPLTMRLGEGIGGQQLRILPSNFGTNIQLNQKAVVRVMAIGVGRDYLGPSGIDDRILVYAKFAADALGYKMARHVTDSVHFEGADLFALQGEVGAVMLAGPFKIRVAFGAGVDVSIGDNVGATGDADGWSLRSDVSAYNEISVDISKFFRFFVRNAYYSVVDSRAKTPRGYALTVGATFIF
jgi:hypothetical protein